MQNTNKDELTTMENTKVGLKDYQNDSEKFTTILNPMNTHTDTKQIKRGAVELDGKWLVGFDGGGRPILTFNRLRAGIFNHAEISNEFSRSDKGKLTFVEINTEHKPRITGSD